MNRGVFVPISLFPNLSESHQCDHVSPFGPKGATLVVVTPRHDTWERIRDTPRSQFLQELNRMTAAVVIKQFLSMYKVYLSLSPYLPLQLSSAFSIFKMPASAFQIELTLPQTEHCVKTLRQLMDALFHWSQVNTSSICTLFVEIDNVGSWLPLALTNIQKCHAPARRTNGNTHLRVRLLSTPSIAL